MRATSSDAEDLLTPTTRRSLPETWRMRSSKLRWRVVLKLDANMPSPAVRTRRRESRE